MTSRFKDFIAEIAGLQTEKIRAATIESCTSAISYQNLAYRQPSVEDDESE